VRAAALATLLVLGLALPAGADPPRFGLYRWTDAQGVVHYTNDLLLVPEGMRAQAITPRAAPIPSVPEAPPAPAPLLPTVEAAPPAALEAAPAAVEAAPGTVAPPVARPLEIEEIAPEDSSDVVRLKRLIAEDRERIKALLANPGVDGPTLASDPGLAEVAARLARSQAELEALRHEPAP
jgi:hypothetical protein